MHSVCGGKIREIGVRFTCLWAGGFFRFVVHLVLLILCSLFRRIAWGYFGTVVVSSTMNMAMGCLLSLCGVVLRPHGVYLSRIEESVRTLLVLDVDGWK